MTRITKGKRARSGSNKSNLADGRRRCRLRCVKAGTTYLLTKKTREDLFLLTPSPEVNLILLYSLFFAAQRYGILIHGFCFMSNHLHLVVTDIRGRLPAFMREFLADSSKALKEEIKSSRPIWSYERYSAVSLLDLDAAERKVVYCDLNPTRAFLTEPDEWPGLTSMRWQLGAQIEAKRPGVYFSPRYRPGVIFGTLAPLPGVFTDEDEQVTDQELKASVQRVKVLRAEELAAIRNDMQRRGAKFLGAKAVRATSRDSQTDRPASTMKPRFATRDRELLWSAISDLARFAKQHEEAKQRYIAGHQKTLFPPGTYGYRELLGVRVRNTVSA